MSLKFTNIIFLILLFSGCDFINPDEKLPAYVELNDFKIVSDDGDVTNNVRDVWIGTASTDLGVYEIPSVVPILEEGKIVVTMSPGVYLNGITSDKNKYFFYKPYKETFDLIRGETIKINPVTSYIDDVVFSPEGSENFEKTPLKFVPTEGNVVETWQDNELGTNNKYGVVKSDNGSKLEMLSKSDFIIDNDKQNAPVYLEFDYKINTQMEVGMYITEDGLTETVRFVTFFPTDEWVHAYVNIWKYQVNIRSNLTLYKIFFRGEADQSTKQDNIAIDNVKVVYVE